MEERTIGAILKGTELYYSGRDLQLDLQDIAEEYSGEVAMAISGIAIGMGMRIKKDLKDLGVVR